MRVLAAFWAVVLVAGCMPSAAGTPPRPPSAAPSASTSVASPGAQRPEVWFAPMPYARPGHDDEIDGSADYDALFSGPDRWPVAAAATDVVAVYSIWVFALATDDQLKAIIASTRARGQRLALELGALRRTDACGSGVEGFDATLEAVDRLHALGGRIDVIAFDEPYYYGHLFTGEHACRWSTDRVAAEVASFVAEVRRAEPGVRVGDIEPLWGAVSGADLGTWLDAYRRASGEPFAFLQMDVGWRRAAAALDDLAATSAEVAARGVELGVIYNGPGARSDKAWTDLARASIAAAEARLEGAPDQAVFQSWEHWPRKALPETDPTTLTGLLRDYAVANGFTR